jgi:hypothetical protein
MYIIEIGVNTEMASSQTPMNGDAARTAPYVPFKSFLTALDRLKQGHPPVIDVSFWHGMSGGLQRQMIITMKFFGLLGENGEVTKELDALARTEDRRTLMGAMLKACYQTVFEIGLEHATPNQFHDALRQYNVSGSTLDKARSFFLQAAKFTEITLSPGIQYLSKRGAPGGKRRSPAASRNREDPPEENGDDELEEEHPPQRGSSRTISLRGGGSATLSFDLDVWSMTPEDQQFVFDMIKRMTEYEQAKVSA